MKRKVIPVLIGLLLIVLILAGAAGVFLFQRYSGSKEEADLNAYFGLNDSQEVAIVWNQELTEEKGLLQDERCYLDTVHEMLNERFYVDHNEKLLLYTLPEETVQIGIGEQTADGYTAAVEQDGDVWLALDYVKQYSDFNYALYTEPNRVVLTTNWDTLQSAELKKNTALRVRGGVKSEVLQNLEKGTKVTVLEEMENWDQVQTHESIRRNFLEETYEACEAIDAGDLVHMREELGDVLMQVLFHTDIEREAGHFDIDDVADAACKKLVYRHPHVFRRDEPDVPDWDTIKQRERAQTTTAEAMDSVARSLPALWRCDKIQAKAAKTGFEWPDVHAALDKVDEETRELRAAVASGDTEAIGDELGDLLFAAVKVARFAGIDPEQAAHAACEKFIRRFSAMETAAANDGTALEQCTLEQMLTLWQQAKQTVGAEQESRKSARQ